MAASDFLSFTHRSVAWFKAAHENDALEMTPPFQRNPVWTPVQKGFLIDTILIGYPIPEMYIRTDVDSQGKEKHTIIDGQQRIRAVLEFLENEVEIHTEPDQTGSGLDGQTFQDLGSEKRELLFGYNFVVRNVPKVDDSTLRAVFQRLNRNNVALNEQELRHATYWGSFIGLMEEIADYDQWESFGLFTPSAVRRMLDVEFISEVAVGILHGPQNKKSSLDKWYKTYETRFDEAKKLRETFRVTIAEVEKVLPALRETRWRKRSDFYSLFLCLAAHEEEFPLSTVKRVKAGRALQRLGEQVDSVIAARSSSNKPVSKGIPRHASKYAAAVEKAASDLGSRKARAEVIEKVLSGILE